MGKFEENHQLEIPNSNQNVISHRCPNISKFVQFKCIIALVFGVSVFLSAIFWLPPFFRYRDRSDLNLDSVLRAHQVVASFKLRRPVSLLKANIPQIELDIFDEIAVPDSTVVVIFLELSAESNTTNVVFAVVPNSKSSNISSASLSLLRSNILSLALNQSTLHLTSSLFGDPFSFEVLKFPGGITVVPQQSAFLLQKVQILFNFTLNSSIDQIQENFDEMKNQLESGLHLSSYEILYCKLTNSYGSTVAPPTTVQAAVLLAIGNIRPPLPRLKQLAQTITGPARNLGLNHTVFGRVKQVRLSSVLQHSLNSGHSGISISPSPAPLPHPYPRKHHHHHHHHHHRHHHHVHLAPAPAPERSYWAKPPSGCQIRFIGKVKRQLHVFPAVAPVVSPRHADASPPQHVDNPPAPAPHLLPASSPLPAVVFAYIHPPNEGTHTVDAPNTPPSNSPLPSSSGGRHVRWLLALLLPLLAHTL